MDGHSPQLGGIHEDVVFRSLQSFIWALAYDVAGIHTQHLGQAFHGELVYLHRRFVQINEASLREADRSLDLEVDRDRLLEVAGDFDFVSRGFHPQIAELVIVYVSFQQLAQVLCANEGAAGAHNHIFNLLRRTVGPALRRLVRLNLGIELGEVDGHSVLREQRSGTDDETPLLSAGAVGVVLVDVGQSGADPGAYQHREHCRSSPVHGWEQHGAPLASVTLDARSFRWSVPQPAPSQGHSRVNEPFLIARAPPQRWPTVSHSGSLERTARDRMTPHRGRGLSNNSPGVRDNLASAAPPLLAETCAQLIDSFAEATFSMTAYRPAALPLFLALVVTTAILDIGCGSSGSSNSGDNTSNPATPGASAPGSGGAGSGTGSGSGTGGAGGGSGSSSGGSGGSGGGAPTSGGTYVYVGNSGGGNISGFRLSSDGKLTAIPGSPFAFAVGTSMALSSGYLITQGNSLKIDPATGSLTQAGSANAGRGTVWTAADNSTAYFCAADGIYAYAFSNGSFTAVPGSPFFPPTSTDDTQQFTCQGLAIDPAAPYLISSHQGFFHNSGTADVIKRLPGGALSPDNHSAGIDKGGTIAVHPNGKFFYITDDPDILAFAIDASGAPQIVHMPSIFLTGSISLAIDPAGKYLFAGAAPQVSVYSIDASSGAISEVAGSPFATGQASGGAGVAVDPGGQFIFVGGNNTVSVMSLNANTGALSPVGSPYQTGSRPGSIVVAHF